MATSSTLTSLASHLATDSSPAWRGVTSWATSSITASSDLRSPAVLLYHSSYHSCPFAIHERLTRVAYNSYPFIELVVRLAYCSRCSRLGLVLARLDDRLAGTFVRTAAFLLPSTSPSSSSSASIRRRRRVSAFDHCLANRDKGRIASHPSFRRPRDLATSQAPGSLQLQPRTQVHPTKSSANQARHPSHR